MRIIDRTLNAHHVNHCTLSFCGTLLFWILGASPLVALTVAWAIGVTKELLWDDVFKGKVWGSDRRGSDAGDLIANAIGLVLGILTILFWIPARL